MQVTAVLLRWYRSFNICTLGPSDPAPQEPWHKFRDEWFPFVRVPLDQRITTIVGANESGKSHLLSAISKVVKGWGSFNDVPDAYEIKDICRFNGFSPLDSIWPEIGLELDVDAAEVVAFQTPRDDADQPTSADGDGTVSEIKVNDAPHIVLTVLLNGHDANKYATVYHDNVVLRTFRQKQWAKFAEENLHDVALINSRLSLPNDIHVDELIDLYKTSDTKPVVDSLAVQDLWRAIEPVNIIHGDTIDAETAKRAHQIKRSIEQSTRMMRKSESKLALIFFRDVLGVRAEDLVRIRENTKTQQGYVAWVSDGINDRIDQELDISRYWDQDEDFRLRVIYKAGTFHFQITDRTGSTYTFNERSSGLKYFLSYYIQAKALEKSNAKRGVIILMDEPDSFLSASGQRSLMRVFDALVSKKSAEAPCQLVYTTHSPFLINRNFPGRVRLVRKGDGSEGTQYVQRGAVRRFEPVRSALSIDAADTLFLGSTNVVLEGHSDQKLISACVQRFGVPGKLDSMLDLNSVTIVSSDGAPKAPDLVRKAMRGDERPPVVVVLLDGDGSGTHFAKEVAKLIDEKQVCTLREIESPGTVFQVLEDIIPTALVAKGLERYLNRLGLACSVAFDGSTTGENQAKKIETFCKANIPGLATHEDVEIRSGVVDGLVELLDDENFDAPELDELKRHVEQVCKKLNAMIEYAERSSNRHSLKKLVSQQAETFLKRFPVSSTKGDVRKLLLDLRQVSYGRGEDVERTQKNLDQLLDRLDAEARENSDSIELNDWRARLTRLKNDPWAVVKDWKSVVALKNATNEVAPAKPQLTFLRAPRASTESAPPSAPPVLKTPEIQA